MSDENNNGNVVVMNFYREPTTIIKNMPHWAKTVVAADDTATHRALARAIIAIEADAAVCGLVGDDESRLLLLRTAGRLNMVLRGSSYAEAFRWRQGAVDAVYQEGEEAFMAVKPPHSD